MIGRFFIISLCALQPPPWHSRGGSFVRLALARLLIAWPQSSWVGFIAPCSALHVSVQDTVQPVQPFSPFEQLGNPGRDVGHGLDEPSAPGHPVPVCGLQRRHGAGHAARRLPGHPFCSPPAHVYPWLLDVHDGRNHGELVQRSDSCACRCSESHPCDGPQPPVQAAVRFRPNEGTTRVAAITNHALIQAAATACISLGFFAIFRNKVRRLGGCRCRAVCLRQHRRVASSVQRDKHHALFLACRRCTASSTSRRCTARSGCSPFCWPWRRRCWAC